MASDGTSSMTSALGNLSTFAGAAISALVTKEHGNHDDVQSYSLKVFTPARKSGLGIPRSRHFLLTCPKHTGKNT